MVDTISSCELDVDRGPDWLFVKIRGPIQDASDEPPLSERIWGLLQEHFAHRLVVELDEIELLSGYLLGQLALLHKRIVSSGGLMRVCGVSSYNEEVLRLCHLDEQLPCYRNREDAVMARCRT
jgi:anti-anti-sigma regulatory factor